MKKIELIKRLKNIFEDNNCKIEYIIQNGVIRLRLPEDKLEKIEPNCIGEHEYIRVYNLDYHKATPHLLSLLYKRTKTVFFSRIKIIFVLSFIIVFIVIYNSFFVDSKINKKTDYIISKIDQYLTGDFDQLINNKKPLILDENLNNNFIINANESE